MGIYRLYFILSFFTLPFMLTGQTGSKRANVWCFGSKAGLDFNSGSPIAFSGSMMDTWEGCASICNTEGDLLFYTDGSTVWDNIHRPMPNANGVSWNTKLSGNQSSAQSAIITTCPCDPSKYYIFTTDGQTCDGPGDPMGRLDGLYYTIVDISLNGGKGDIDLAYLSLQAGYVPGSNKIALIDSVAEKVNVAIHANGVDYWVVVQRVSGEFYSFLVDCSGINTTPVIYPSGEEAGASQMAFSKDGKCLVVSEGYPSGSVYMFDFDNTSGVLSNKRTLITDFWEFDGMAAWSICFSPNDSIIYVAPWEGNGYKRFKRFAPDVKASGVLDTLPTNIVSIQLGPDGKIYVINNWEHDYLAAFNAPDNFSNPGFVSNSVALSPGTWSGMGLPNIFAGISSMNQKEFVRSDTSYCTEHPISLAIGKPPVGCFYYSWDPITGLDDPTSSNPTATLEYTTTYKVSVTSSCATYEDFVTVRVSTCEESMAFIPNTFTPNNDGLNDIFIPLLYDYVNTQYALQIFDRWGNLLFTTNDYKQGWNGCVGSGTITAQHDVYVYKVFATDMYGLTLEKVGHVTLLR